MKLGLTTNCFANALGAGETDLASIIEFAESEGFTALELRDNSAQLPADEVRDLLKDAGSRQIALSYAVANDMFVDGDPALVAMAVERAALCGPGSVLRLLASQSALKPPEKKGYNALELARIAAIARNYADSARRSSVNLALEHAAEPLYGDGDTYFGLHDIIVALETSGGVPGNLGLTFDPANAVSVPLCKAPTGPERVMEFLSTHSQYIALVHYKTTDSGNLTPVITDADVDNERLFEELSGVYDGVVCLEIPPADSLAECKANIAESLEYMRLKGLMGYFDQ